MTDMAVKHNKRKYSGKTYDVSFDINYFVRVKAKNKEDAIDQALEIGLDKTDGQSEARNIKTNETEN